jgi:hypothetical protein
MVMRRSTRITIRAGMFAGVFVLGFLYGAWMERSDDALFAEQCVENVTITVSPARQAGEYCL